MNLLPDWINVRDNLWGSLIWSLLAAITTVAIGWWLWAWRGRRRKLYLPLVLTDSENFIKQVEDGAAAFFTTQGFLLWGKIPRLAEMPQHRSGRIGLLDEKVWRELWEETLKTFRKAETSPKEELHVVFGTLAMWNLAMGTLLKNNHHRHVLYHLQNGTYNRIWQINRQDIKDRKSPVAGHPFVYSFFQREYKAPLGASHVLSSSSECFVFQVGTNHIVDDVQKHRDQYLPNAPIRIFTKQIASLDPKEPGQWTEAASEIAHALCESRESPANDRYVFFDGPAVLTFMVGDALGDYSGCRFHLMQWVKSGVPMGTYREMICLPDESLSKIAG